MNYLENYAVWCNAGLPESVNQELSSIKNNEDEGSYYNFFLYDGKDMFFFPEEVTLNINNKEYKKLGPMSYVNVVAPYETVVIDGI